MEKDLERYRVVCSGSSGSIVVLETCEMTDAIKRAWSCIRDDGIEPDKVDIFALDTVSMRWFSWFEEVPK